MTAAKAFSLSITPQVILFWYTLIHALIRGSGHTLLRHRPCSSSQWKKKPSHDFSSHNPWKRLPTHCCGNRQKALRSPTLHAQNFSCSVRRWKSISNLSILKTCFIWVSAKNQKRISDWHATSLTASLASTMLSLSSGGRGGIFEVRSHMAKSEMKIKFIRKMYEDWFVK